MNTKEERKISAPTIDIAIKRSTQCTVSKGLTDLLSDLFATKWGTFSVHEIVSQRKEKAVLLHTVFRVVILSVVCMDMAKRRC